MKAKFFLSAVLTGALALTACNKKIDEKTLGEITTFGTDWTALGEKATAWAGDLEKAGTDAKAHAAKVQEFIAASGDKIAKDANLKTQLDEAQTKANADVQAFEGMNAEWTSFKTSWEENTKSFGEWKDKLTTGQITAEDATKGLAEWKTKMEEAKGKIETWSTSFASAKESCMKNMEAATALFTPAEATK